VKAERETFAAQQTRIRPEEIIAIDEMGIVTGMSRAYGYARRGKRAISSELAAKGTRLSVVGALTVEGFLGGLEVTGTVNGDVFEAFIQQIVLPHLRPGKLVWLDNATFHHGESIQAMIEATGARVVFLPPYSPEFNPIEACWSKLKAWIRKQTPESVHILQRALTEAIQQVTKQDAAGWFRHAGFSLNNNE
jgi:transposase